MRHEAILNLYPNVVIVDDTAGCFDADGNPVAITQSLVDEEAARLQAEYDSKAYARARAEAYAPIADQLDMQYWDSVNGSRTWLDHIEAVKEAHPK
tara:strand:+ start:520 stop:807 length:288 start_codon:yes stop_codon:yes gene_type:complete